MRKKWQKGADQATTTHELNKALVAEVLVRTSYIFLQRVISDVKLQLQAPKDKTVYHGAAEMCSLSLQQDVPKDQIIANNQAMHVHLHHF